MQLLEADSETIVLMDLLQELRREVRAASALASLVGQCTDHTNTSRSMTIVSGSILQVHKHNH